MKSVVPEWYGHDADALKTIITTGTIALDANVLLDLYRVRSEQRQDIFGVLRKVKDRLFIPYQVALEFHENRLEVVRATNALYDKLIAGSTPTTEILNSIKDLQLRKEIEKVFEHRNKHLIKHIEQLREKHAVSYEEARSDDPVLGALDDLLDDSVFGKRPSAQILETRRKESEQRRESKIPPGFADRRKADPDGDYLIWAELLDLRKNSTQPLLFVTGDQKPDWYREDHGQTLGPRIELVAEMLSAAPAQLYHQVDLYGFLWLAGEFLDSKVPESTLEAVRSTSRDESFAFSSKALEAMYPDQVASPAFRDLLLSAFAAATDNVGWKDAVKAGNFDIAASLALSPEVQRSINATVLRNNPEILDRMGLPATAEIYEAALRQASLASESSDGAHGSLVRDQQPTTAQPTTSAKAAGKSTGKSAQSKKPRKSSGTKGTE